MSIKLNGGTLLNKLLQSKEKEMITMEYGKIENNAIRISKEKIEGYKTIAEERPLNGGGVFKEYADRGECIAKVYVEKQDDDTKERLDTLESAVMELGELVSNMEGVNTDGEAIS